MTFPRDLSKLAEVASYNMNPPSLACTTTTYASNITLVRNTNIRINATANLTLFQPSVGQDCDMVRVWVTNNALSSIVLTLALPIKIPAGAQFTGTTTILPGVKARIGIQYDSVLNGGQWELINFTNGY